jgi:hypothetical protein
MKGFQEAYAQLTEEEKNEFDMWVSKLKRKEKRNLKDLLRDTTAANLRMLLKLSEEDRIVYINYKGFPSLNRKHLKGIWYVVLVHISIKIWVSGPSKIKEVFGKLVNQGFTAPQAEFLIAAMTIYELRRAVDEELRRAVDAVDEADPFHPDFSLEEWYESLKNKESSPPKDQNHSGHRLSDILKVACSAAAATKVIIEFIKAWVEDRKGRVIKIKEGDVELELHGGMNQTEIEERIKTFRELLKEKDDNNHIILP